MRPYSLCLLLFLSIFTAQGQFLTDKENVRAASGFFDFHYVESEGKIYLEVARLDEPFLYVHSLRTGLGSNDIGLDRGQLGGTALVRFIRSGDKLLLVQENTAYRANTDNSKERQSIKEAFGRSVLYAFPIKETQANTHLIDLTPFLYLDAHGVARTLKRGKDGNYKLDKSRSVLWMERTKSFPQNTEFESMITFVGEPQGRRLGPVVPDATSVSVIQHHSFVKLPDDGFTPRAFDPRSGAIHTYFMDYSTPIWEPIGKRFALRHRLEKKDPEAAVSEAVEPIIYYLDPGTPEPVRSALLEGASWWDQAFQAIGYQNAFQVKMLPEGADPMDVRYNTIQWVHRSTRGWSYGASVSDPRTGEIIKGHVSLGSLRIRQDFLIAQALSDKPYAKRDDNHQQMLEMALARIRQLSAHEVGHTLGFAHNFAASTNGRASVMDYPHPTLRVKGKKIDLSNAYDTGIGDWDKVTVAYSYGTPPAGVSEITYLNSVLEGAFADGLRFITDGDARPTGGAHHLAHLWDNGTDATKELENVLDVRAVGIRNFSKDNISTGTPYTVLEDVFVPLYFYHRYQTEATVKLIGGMEYDYLVKGYNGSQPASLGAKQQRAALQAMLLTLDAETLAIPKGKLDLFPPRAFGHGRTRESFKSRTGVAFDPWAAPATAADLSFSLLLHPQRANRLVEQKTLDEDQLGLAEVLESIEQALFDKAYKDAYINGVQEQIQEQYVGALIALERDTRSMVQVRGAARLQLQALLQQLDRNQAAQLAMALQIEHYFKAPEKYKPQSAPKIPDGSPIGSFQCSINQIKG